MNRVPAGTEEFVNRASIPRTQSRKLSGLKHPDNLLAKRSVSGDAPLICRMALPIRLARSTARLVPRRKWVGSFPGRLRVRCGSKAQPLIEKDSFAFDVRAPA